MATIIIASSRKGEPERPRELWADVLMALNSVSLYAAEHDAVLAWQGPCAPEGQLDNPRARVLRQPDSCASYGEAYGWAVEQSAGDELILMNDDAVLLPDSVPALLADVSLIRKEHPQVKIGMLASRTNYAPGPQNIRAPNDGILQPNFMAFDSESRILASARVSPILAFITREALDAIGGFPPINWFSDDLMCFDLLQKGYTNFVSRSYVHHIGMRATLQDGVTREDLHRSGLEWVKRNRPDFWNTMNR